MDRAAVIEDARRRSDEQVLDLETLLRQYMTSPRRDDGSDLTDIVAEIEYALGRLKRAVLDVGIARDDRHWDAPL